MLKANFFALMAVKIYSHPSTGYVSLRYFEFKVLIAIINSKINKAIAKNQIN